MGLSSAKLGWPNGPAILSSYLFSDCIIIISSYRGTPSSSIFAGKLQGTPGMHSRYLCKE
jgi:hypothetical protein